MDFFKLLSAVNDGVELNLTIKQAEGKLILLIQPKAKDKEAETQIKPISIIDTVKELDEEQQQCNPTNGTETKTETQQSVPKEETKDQAVQKPTTISREEFERKFKECNTTIEIEQLTNVLFTDEQIAETTKDEPFNYKSLYSLIHLEDNRERMLQIFLKLLSTDTSPEMPF